MEKFDVVRVEKIKDSDKKKYTNVGILLVKDDGNMSIKLNAVPVGNWDGWLSCYKQKAKDQAPPDEISDMEPF